MLIRHAIVYRHYYRKLYGSSDKYRSSRDTVMYRHFSILQENKYCSHAKTRFLVAVESLDAYSHLCVSVAFRL